ncbi:hypothetical protein GF389_01250 [Candidatus Dojkabacteria bacterium]|nr:hypothetical protein [Candidatus Dojkabacteria bacterium]
MAKKKSKPQSLKDLFMKNDVVAERMNAAKYVRHEFQDYGYRLAVKLNDLEHKSLYIKLAKNEKRPLLDQALSYTLDYPKARNKAKIFMWKLGDLKRELKSKKDAERQQNKNLELL